MKPILSILIAVLITSCQSPQSAPLSLDPDQKEWAFPYFEKVDSINPILRPSPDLTFTDPITGQIVKWEQRNVLNPTAVVRNDSVFLLYRAQDTLGTSRIGMAISTDGLHFEKNPEPIFYPDQDAMKPYEWNFKKDLTDQIDPEDCYFCYFDGVEDPRIVQSDAGDYIMTYTAYDGKTARLSIASSTDLVTWVKHGLVIKQEKYKDLWSKAEAIVSELQDHKMVAKRIDGLYWLYFGDTDIFMAYSEDLIQWTVAENSESQKMISVLHPRMGYFDSRLVEPGPYAMVTEQGILLIYNGSNAENFNDPSIPKFTYSAGQALFDKDLPYRQIDRTTQSFIRPDKDYEKMGEVNEVCFVEGLVYFKEKWFLYYGTADSKIAVAVYKGALGNL